MATRLQLRKGTTTEHSTFIGAEGEVTVDTTKKALVLHDGVTTGGKPLPTLESGKVPLDQLTDSTTSTKGIVQLATQSEVNVGTNNTKAMTPNTLGGGVRTLLNVSGGAPMYACRAWVNFNGTGTVAIRASGNVSSITDNGVGDYTINLMNAMPDINYSITGFANFTSNSTAGFIGYDNSYTPTTSGVPIQVGNTTTGGKVDVPHVHVQVFR